MKLNPIPALIALIYTVINVLFYMHATTLTGGASMGYVFIFPMFWIITALGIIVLSIRKRKSWFSKDLLLSTLVSLLFCTPIPLLAVGIFTRPDSYPVSEGYRTVNGNALKDESWDYYNGQRAAKKYWKNEKKDSIWVYFNKNGDTILTETYKEDSLISKKDYK
ncbi:hypothetical protein GCM10027049_04680 [Mucilaginibacter puniceus]